MALYWRFRFHELVDAAGQHGIDPAPKYVADPVDGGDACHGNIHHVTPGQSPKLLHDLANPPEDHIRICGDADVAFSYEALERMI